MNHMDHMDHMDHGQHPGHDGHDGHDMHDDPCAHAGHGHAMVFHAGVCQEILFSGWMTTNALELFGSAVAIFFAGVLYEGLKYFREALHARASSSTGDSRVNITKSECGANGPCGGTAVVKYTMFSSGHVIQTLLHFLQSTASYTLMLVFMTYNVWLCIALVLGLAVGYFFFGWRKNTVVDVNEHCQ
ncbi:high affinity copper uptake protein 1 [Spodoptera litura]|uniref:Copper transport protein n=1 Tax=Spodoptera litura TaxID=69820 RepID=A0A9J7DUW0_SPOLT|nr:high affinity copper uptake protein 1 [Spodoptera litura]XP_022817363.1 high affinity copper uptake protein 1 [Spodoptera litura]XP_022817364.1 high affinity copper uptake protein 1 [Spodoptera litura]